MGAIYGRQAITTKYLGPTNNLGGRVKATCEAGTVTAYWNHALDATSNHAEAARQLAIKLGWSGTWHMGGTKDFYVFVNAAKGTEFIVPGKD